MHAVTGRLNALALSPRAPAVPVVPVAVVRIQRAAFRGLLRHQFRRGGSRADTDWGEGWVVAFVSGARSRRRRDVSVPEKRELMHQPPPSLAPL